MREDTLFLFAGSALAATNFDHYFLMSYSLILKDRALQNKERGIAW